MPNKPMINDDQVALACVRTLKAERKKRGLTSSQLAKMLHVHPSTISHIENLNRPVSVSIYNSLAAIFKWPLYMQGGNDNLLLNFDCSDRDTKQSDVVIPEEQLRDIQDIAKIKNCSVSELLSKLIAPYKEAVDSIRNL